jgi:hypothetical protein
MHVSILFETKYASTLNNTSNYGRYMACVVANLGASTALTQMNMGLAHGDVYVSYRKGRRPRVGMRLCVIWKKAEKSIKWYCNGKKSDTQEKFVRDTFKE